MNSQKITLSCPISHHYGPAMGYLLWRFSKDSSCHDGMSPYFNVSRTRFINSLCDAIWRFSSGSTLVLLRVCCLMAPSHYLNQCWLFISELHWHSRQDNFTTDTQPSSTSSTKVSSKMTFLKFHSNLPGANSLSRCEQSRSLLPRWMLKITCNSMQLGELKPVSQTKQQKSWHLPHHCEHSYEPRSGWGARCAYCLPTMWWL